MIKNLWTNHKYVIAKLGLLLPALVILSIYPNVILGYLVGALTLLAEIIVLFAEENTKAEPQARLTCDEINCARLSTEVQRLEASKEFFSVKSKMWTLRAGVAEGWIDPTEEVIEKLRDHFEVYEVSIPVDSRIKVLANKIKDI